MNAERPTFKAWITRYALTSGIREIVAEETHLASMISDINQSHIHYHGEGKDWHRTHEGAVKQAGKMRVAKIKSLRNSIAILEKVSFQ
jgi:tRNA G10  N-methylase Trm11